MIALIVVAILLVLLWNIPVGVVAEYSDGGATVKAEFSFLRFLLYPRRKKEKPDEPQEDKIPEVKELPKPAPKAEPVKKQTAGENSPVTTVSAAPKSAPDKKTVVEEKPVPEKKQTTVKPKETPGEESEPTKEKKKHVDVKALITGGNIPLFRELLGLALEAVGHIRRKLEITNLRLYLSLGGFGDDPAASALLYAKAWAAIGALTPVLENTFSIRNRDIQASVDFTTTENWIYGLAELRLKLGEILMIGLYYGLRGLKIFLKIKKGGKNNGTSDQ